MHVRVWFWLESEQVLEKQNQNHHWCVSHKAQNIMGLCLQNPVTLGLKKIAWLNNLKKKDKIIIELCYDFFTSSIKNSLMTLTIKTLK